MFVTTPILIFLIGSIKIHVATATSNDVNPLAARSNNENDYDCTAGCPGFVDPVCGSGVTYQNECLPRCQELQGVIPGSCNGFDDTSDSDFVSTSVIENEVMNRFVEVGFKYVGLVENRPDDISDDKDYPTLGSSHSSEDSAESPDDRVLIVTTTGDMYVGPANHGDIDEYVLEAIKGKKDSNAALSSSKGADSSDGRTAESVFLPDTRARVPPSPGWPYWRIAYVDRGSWACSGTLVGKDKVLTNAHCAYDFEERKWIVPFTVIPGRNPDANYGCWSVATATVHTKYKNTGNENYDFAILTMNENSQGHIGDVLGFFPIVSSSCEDLQSTDTKKRIIGYPSDKPKGTMWSSEVCEDWSYSCSERLVFHKCDTYKGNSGSGIFMYDTNGDMKVVGIHAFGTDEGFWNSGPAFSPKIATMLNNW